MDKLYFLPINESSNKTVFKQLLSLVSNEKKDKVNRFHFDIDKKLSLYAELLVRIIAVQTFDIDNAEIIFEKGDHGKPYIKGFPNFHYNISHTKNAIAVATSNYSVGVDIERIRTAELQIANRFFTAAEQEYVNGFVAGADKRFYEMWTKKEAYIKYTGEGLSTTLNSFNVFEETISKQIATFEINKYIISVCSEFSYKNYEIVEITENQVESKTFLLLK